MEQNMLPTLDIEQLKESAKENKGFSRIKLKILERDNFQCVRCGSKEELTIDHKIKQKSYSLKACETLCAKCHIQKDSMMYEARMMRINNIKRALNNIVAKKESLSVVEAGYKEQLVALERSLEIFKKDRNIKSNGE